MQITVYVKEDQLEELANFLSSDIQYEHAIDFFLHPAHYHVAVHLFYKDYAVLKDMRMKEPESTLSLFDEQS